MKPIPVSAVEKIAKQYGYDQVVIIARKAGDDPEPHGEHCTTYGVNKTHCAVAAKIGDFLKYKVMGWVKENTKEHASLCIGCEHTAHKRSECGVGCECICNMERRIAPSPSDKKGPA